MTELSIEEVDLLERVKASPELRRLFFRKAKGLKWFTPLRELGYFSGSEIPSPIPGKEEGYISIPGWDALDYLVRTIEDLDEENREALAPQFLQIILEATCHAKENGYGNYHAWWGLAKVLSRIPVQFVSERDLEVVDYWLEDKFDNGLVSEEVGEKWLANLLEEASSESIVLATELLSILFSVDFVDNEFDGRTTRKAVLRLKYYHAERIVRKISDIAGQRIGADAVLVFQQNLEKALEEVKNDTWSCVWMPAIEEHEQNNHREDAECVLIAGYRDTLQGYVDSDSVKAKSYISTLLDSPFQTVRRVAIHCIGGNYSLLGECTNQLIREEYLDSNYRHEIWHFFNRNYGSFTEEQKKKVLALIDQKVRTGEDGLTHEGATAYEKGSWLAAVKTFGQEELDLYNQAVSLAKTDPEHPDFSSYMTTGWGGQESPYSVEELSSMDVDSLIETLTSYIGGSGWQEPGVEDLSRAVKQLFKTAPLTYYDRLKSFSDLDLAYIQVIIEAYKELWVEKASLPWGDVWHQLLSLIGVVVEQDRLWANGDKGQGEKISATGHWIVASIARLIEVGVKSDDHAIDTRFDEAVLAILEVLLEKESGKCFDKDSDAVFVAINSPRGNCLEALINVSLRCCRLNDRENDGDHSMAWSQFEMYFDAELERGDNGEYEFATLVTNYLPNFLYMSKDWVLLNLSRIFDQTRDQKWSCAMQGYSYVGTVYQEIYDYLLKNGDFIRALDDSVIADRIRDRVIENIAIAFINDYEAVDRKDSLLAEVLNRGKVEEIQHLIWFIWTRRNDEDTKLKDKILLLWPQVVSVIDYSTKEGRGIASRLCLWAAFVDQINASSRKYLMAISKYADEDYNSFDFLGNLARISESQPLEVNEIWREFLKGSASDYPPEAVRNLLTNLVSQGDDGIRLAKETVSEYLRLGVERPYDCLEEILGGIA